MRNDPLTRDEVVSVMEGRALARRVPMFIHFWTNPDAGRTGAIDEAADDNHQKEGLT